MAGEIIPFGKYKGQDIEQVRARDPQYLQWLLQQAWFQEKFAPVYQIVVNNFAPASEDTPAHNALQVRFLEHDLRCAFWRVAAIKVDWQELERIYRRNIEHLCQPPRPSTVRRDLRKASDRWEKEWATRRLDEHRQRVRSLWEKWRRVRRSPSKRSAVGRPTFETACDVEFDVETYVGYPDIDFTNLNGSITHRMMIEIKPSMGDDYPAVLRQMKRQQASTKDGNSWTQRRWFLLVDEFASSVVTLDQVRQIFAQDDIKVVLMAEVREQLIKLKGE